MQGKIKYIFTTLILISLILGTTGCSIFLPQSPTSYRSNSSTETIDPNWTFPSRDNPPVTLPSSFRDVVARAKPAVVAVTTEIFYQDIFGHKYSRRGAGSGIIIDGDKGYIVTNYHVVQDARNVKVELADGKTSFPANIVGTDALTDLAVLKIDAAGLPYASWGDSDLLAIGDLVLAIGNALGEGISATEGIVSRLNVSVTVQGNTLSGLIQTTAAINPGNSGGPLVNMHGEVIGINSVKVAAVGVEGMGYAISSNGARRIITELIHWGYVTTRAWLGVEEGLYTVDQFVALWNNLSVDHGALITKVAADSPAEAARLKEGDIIVRFNDKEITSAEGLLQAILDCQIGQKVKITFVRGKDTLTTRAQLKENPPP